MRIYNTLTQYKDEFIPLKDKQVKIYVCGITPYDTTHIGHAFTYLFFDVLVRFLSFQGYSVNYTQNVTDVDDDILKRANELKTDWKDLGFYWTKRFLVDMKSLNALFPTHYVTATNTIQEIIHITDVLIGKKYAYKAKGNVYFRADKFRGYGKLSKYPIEEMIKLLKERGGNPADPLKKNPLDFILWQSSKPDEPKWDSPWSKGRPGWHIECSSMIYKYLGPQIDIHGGGADLIFPHHESEIAQSESFTGKRPFVKYWLHTAMVRFKGNKMSKSLGNLVLISDLLKRYSVNVIRYYLLSHFYRTPWEFDYDKLAQSEKNLGIIYNALKLKQTSLKFHRNNPYYLRLVSLLGNDMDIPSALFLLQEMAEEILDGKNNSRQNERKIILKELFELLGFQTPDLNRLYT